MKRLVIDASVILKTLLKEDPNVYKTFETLLKKAIKGEINLLSSKLLAIEVANGLRFSLQDKKASLNIYKDFLNLPIKTIVLTRVQKEESLRIAYDLGSSVYDSSYHILAKAQRAVFLTGDGVYFKKANILGDIEFLG
ncbi:hypothetical protein A3D78_06255 [Candidatus Gottesmanbacteria bacterium RIFCSPHIGHO2_02_FULL_39_14]|uniref:PIN domain-containing protein n=1 Tax=Candidatus Gottesmanbacteria bacterium RIFCSPHIGHO2_02_FULL_39_14 TaxID=1798383 RepID=A0A1F5ZXY6_9BACT|nr:MAG: hypothetical protein A3D78_06255 [Candidatus Gottesmanbacteria bacterium RIFCSPHIGHO2_02_FULL_39_14]